MSGILLISFSCLLWAIDTLIRYPLIGAGVSSLKIVFYEHAIFCLIFSWFFIKMAKKIWELRISQLFSFFVIGGIGSALGTYFFTHAFSLMNPSLVILLQKLQPVVAIILSLLILGERVRLSFIFLAVIAMGGSYLMSYEDLAPVWSGILKGEISGNAKGYLYALGAVVGWGASTVFGKRLCSQRFSELEIVSGRFFAGFLTLTPMMFFFGESFQLSAPNLGKVAVMVLLSGILGLYFYYKGLKRMKARLCALVEMLFPFFAIIINWLFLSKELTFLQVIGGAILIVSSTVIQLKKY